MVAIISMLLFLACMSSDCLITVKAIDKLMEKNDNETLDW